MYSHILVPVSFDDDRNAEAAIDVAKKLVATGGKVTLFHVMEQIPRYAVQYIPDGFHDDAQKAILVALAEMTSGFEKTNSVVVDGHSGRTILDWAEEHDVDCIVIASHRPGMQDYFLGSTASQVVRHAKCAVHVIR